MDERTVRQIALVRYYLVLAEGQFAIEQQASKFAAINLLHEALESTLISCAEHLNAGVSERATIDQYLDKIDNGLPGASLPFRAEVLRFNRARISAKHALTLPEPTALNSFFNVIPEFCREAVRMTLGADLNAVNLVGLIENDEIREYVNDAIRHQHDLAYYEGLACIRKAFFLIFEKSYDISVFENSKEGEAYGLLDPKMLCKAPSYAKSNRYIHESVRDPFDYIALDHALLDAESLKCGIDTTAFWNIWRLTPKVWRRPSGEW